MRLYNSLDIGNEKKRRVQTIYSILSRFTYVKEYSFKPKFTPTLQVRYTKKLVRSQRETLLFWHPLVRLLPRFLLGDLPVLSRTDTPSPSGSETTLTKGVRVEFERIRLKVGVYECVSILKLASVTQSSNRHYLQGCERFVD